VRENAGSQIALKEESLYFTLHYVLPLHTLPLSLLTVFLKIEVFWDITPYSLVEVADVSEFLTVSIIRAMSHLDDDGRKHF
jgi:hypothetical protein